MSTTTQTRHHAAEAIIKLFESAARQSDELPHTQTALDVVDAIANHIVELVKHQIIKGQ